MKTSPQRRIEIQHIHVSRLNSVYDTSPRRYSLSTILKEISQGDTTVAKNHPKYRTLAEMTRFARDVLLANPHPEMHKDAYDRLKSSAPQFTPATVLNTRTDVKALTGIVLLEFDAPDVDYPYLIATASQNLHCLSVFRSFSSKPKILIAIETSTSDGVVLTTDNFKYAWATASQLFEDIAVPDTSAMSTTQLQAFCHDPNIYIAPFAIPLSWHIDEDAFTETWGESTGTTAEITAFTELSPEYIVEIQRIDAENGWKKRSGWAKSRYKVPCPFGGDHEFDRWGGRTNGTSIRKNGENDFTLHCFKCSKSKRYTQQKPDDLKRTLRTSPAQEQNTAPKQTIDQIRQQLATAFEDAFEKVRAHRSAGTRTPLGFLISAFTGAGKSTAKFDVLATEIDALMAAGIGILSVSLTSDLRDQDNLDALKHFNTDLAHNWKGRHTGFEIIQNLPLHEREQNESLFQKGVLCPIADQVAEATQRGITGQQMCSRCLLKSACETQGWRANYTKARGALYISISLQDVLDPAFAGFLDTLRRVSGIKLDTLFFDDFSFQNLLTGAGFSWEEIKTALQNRKQSRDEDLRNAAFFLDKLLEAGLTFWQTDDVAQFHNTVNNFMRYRTDENLQSIRNGLSRVYYDGEVHEAIDLFDYGVNLADIPRVWGHGNSLLDRIIYFLEDNSPDAANVSIGEGELYFSHKVRLAHSGIRYLFLISATQDVDLAKSCIVDSIDFHQYQIDTPLELAEGNQFFQFGKARVTTQSVFVKEGTKVIGLTEQAKKDLSQICLLVEHEKQNTGNKAIFISHKEFIDNDFDCDVVKRIHDTFEIVTHYHKIIGLNFEDYTIGCCYGMPKAATKEIHNLARAVNSGGTQPIPTGEYVDLTEFQVSEQHGMKVGGHAFKDERLEQVRIQLINGTFQQAVGRGRSFVWNNRKWINHSNLIIAESKHSCIYDRTDLHRATTFDELQQIISQREHAEMERNIQDIAQTQDVSERSAYRQTQEQRKEITDEFKTIAYQLYYYDGMSYREIENELEKRYPNEKIPTFSTIRRWLTNYTF